MYWIRRKIWQIKNLIKWFPVIWNQYDFDDSYAVEVFMFQLGKIADFLDSDKAYSVSAKSNASSIRRLLKLMKAVQDEKFAMDYQEEFEKLYGKADFTWEDYDKNPNLKELKWKFPVVKGKTEEELDKIYTEMFRASHDKQEKAHKLMWKLVEENIRRWWD